MTEGLQELYVVVRGGGGPDSKGSAFFKVLRVSAETVEDLSPSRSASQWALARLFSVRADDLKHAAEPTEEFAQRVREGFARATEVEPFQRTPWEGLASLVEPDRDTAAKAKTAYG